MFQAWLRVWHWLKAARWYLAGAAVVLALVWAFIPQPVPVETAPVSRGPFEQAIQAEGRTRAKARYIVSAPVAGRLLRVALKAGDPVRRGMVVAILAPGDSPLLDERSAREARERLGAAGASRSRVEAAVERARTGLDLAQSDLARMTRLAAGGSIAPVELERAQATAKVRQKELEGAQFDADAAQHDVEMARAALQQASRAARGDPGQARRWDIESPVNARVLRVFQESETVLPAGAPILEVADPGLLEAVIDVLSTDAVQIRPGALARIERWGGGEDLQAQVWRVEPGAFTKISALGVEEQRVNVILEILSPPERWTALGDGYRVEAEIAVFSAPSAVTVPISALYRVGDSWAVFELADGHARQRLVQLGRRNPLAAVVEAGLSPGQVVILYPGDQIRDGLRVTPR